jgi:hypothetical protein
MAITNAQQYQQLVNKPADGKRPGYKGDDYGQHDVVIQVLVLDQSTSKWRRVEESLIINKEG